MSQGELLRKLVHISFGFVAISLKWLSTPAAAGVAASALLFNWLVLPRVGGKRIARTGRGYDTGIILYPLAVLVLILSFPARPEIPTAIWAIIAFGDGFSTLAGKVWGVGRLPWNRDKSWVGMAMFIAMGLLTAYPLTLFVAATQPFLGWFAIVAITVLICAGVESLHTNIDDNLTVPLAGALTMAALVSVTRLPRIELDRTEMIWLGVNALLAIVGYAARSVDLSGMIGGAVLGAALILFGGWPLFVILLLFFVIGSLATKLGYRRKLSLGLAQEKGGRRGFSHAFANVGVAAICALLIATSGMNPMLFWLAAVASLATATADTTGSEVGQWIGKKAFMPLTFRPVPVGTEGAISVEGTLAGALTSLGVASVAAALAGMSGLETGALTAGRIILICSVAAIAGSYIESVVGSWNRTRGRKIPNGVMNFFNTLVGAGIAIVAALIGGVSA